MLLQFSFQNFLSFKERMTFSMMASSLKEPVIDNTEVMTNIGHSIGSVLHCAAIYGANASGKSNVVKALDTFRWLVVNSMKEMQSGEKIKVEPYRLNSATATQPSVFEITLCDADNIYRYGFESDVDKVHSEWLYQKAKRKRSKEVELIFREGETFAIHSRLSIAKDVASKKMVRDNALLLSVAAQFNDPVAVAVTSMISEITILSSHDDERMWRLAVANIDNEKMRRRIVAFSKYADLGIDDIEKVNGTILSRHVQYDDDGNTMRQVSFLMDENESEGTLKYFRLAYPLLNALDNGSTVVIDELDSQLHPVLTANIISMFNLAKTNPKNAQLIFTLHDTNVLGAGFLRRDQIWFTQKDRKGESELYSLAEYNVRSGAPFAKDYLAGKYGAIPLTGTLSDVLTTNASLS